MKLMKLLSLGALAGWTCVTTTSAAPTFQGVGTPSTATAVSADGSTVVGVENHALGFRWTRAGVVTLLADGSARSDLHVLWLGGTGRFQSVTGEGDVVCLHGVTEGAHLEYITEGTLTRP